MHLYLNTTFWLKMILDHISNENASMALELSFLYIHITPKHTKMSNCGLFPCPGFKRGHPLDSFCCTGFYFVGRQLWTEPLPKTSEAALCRSALNALSPPGFCSSAQQLHSVRVFGYSTLMLYSFSVQLRPGSNKLAQRPV